MTDINLNGSELQRFEREINDNKGAWLYFNKLPPAEDAAAAGGGKALPGKPGAKVGGAIEELKAVNGRAWIDLTLFSNPNQDSNISHQRFVLESIVKEGEENIFETQQTYVMVTVSLSNSLYPKPSKESEEVKA